MNISAHADYVAQPQSVASQAARYSVMNISELQNAAKAGQAGAQFYLASRYQYGKDVAKDEKQAFSLFKAAADQGLSSAQLNVGRMYADGIGTHKDETLARKYFEKAASNGDNRASFNLAMMEEQKKNFVGAYQWYELSTRDGMLDTKVISLSEGKKTALAANLTQDQIRAARDRADKWIQAQ
ncbi:MAG TPA: tetratricopeptide repeat protein [Acinetobacter sp.]|nr:tetratricopeptide repeat protein [Acinetobacter sp.]